MKTEAAKAAAMIRSHLKQHRIRARVRSKTYSMGSSVDVDITDQLPETVKQVKAYCSQFQYGHFDGMQDLYEYSNSRDDIPQAKHVFVNAKYSAPFWEEAYQWLRATMGDYQNAPATYDEAKNLFISGNYSVSDDVWRVLNGTYWNGQDGGFWSARKPRIKAA